MARRLLDFFAKEFIPLIVYVADEVALIKKAVARDVDQTNPVEVQDVQTHFVEDYKQLKTKHQEDLERLNTKCFASLAVWKSLQRS